MTKSFINKYLFTQKLDWALIFLWSPIFLQSIMIFILTVSNNALLGHLGVDNLAALGIGGNYINAIMGIFFFFSLTATTAVAFYKGAGEKEKNTMTQIDCMIFAGGAGILATIFFELLTPSFLGLFQSGELVRNLTILYSQTFLLSIPFIFFNWACIGILKGLQKVNLLVKISGGFLAFEIIINIFFVEICHFGIMGVGLGPIIANLIQAFIFTYFICKDFDKKTVKHYRPHIFRLLKLSKDNFPLMIRSGAFWIIILLSLWCFSILGTQYVAAGQLGDAILSFAMYAFDALAAAAQTLVGEARGSKNQNRILEIIHRTRRLSRLFIPAVIVFYLAGGWVLTHLMTDDITVSDLSFLLILLSLIPLPIISYTYTLDGVFLGFAKYNFLMKASLIGAITSMALMFCLTNIIHNAFWLFAIIYLVYETVFVGIRGIYNYLEYKKLIH